MVVYTTDDGGFAEVAERIATDREEELTSDFEAALAHDEAVVWVDDLPNVDGRQLLDLQERLLERGPDRGSFGVITGYTPELAEELYFDRVEHDGEDTLVYGTLAPDTVPESPDTTVLTGDDATAETVESLTDEPVRSFQILGNGRLVHIYLSEGLVCGFPESQHVEEYAEPQPFCVTDGERDCPLDGDLVTAESIDASHVFIASCSATIDNGTGGLPVHVAMGLLNGADSLVGSYRVSPTRRHEPLLHYALLASGYDAAERTYLLNRNSHANAIMSHAYVSFGRPDAAVEDAHDPQFEVEMDASGDDVRVRLTDVDAFVVDLRIPGERVPDYDDRLYVRNLTGTTMPVYYSVFEEGDDVRLLAYTGGLMDFEHLELEVSADRAMHDQRRIAVESAKNAEYPQTFGFLTDEATEQVDQLRSQVRNLGPKTEYERFDANAYEEVDHRLASILGQADAIRDELLSYLRAENPGALVRTYARHAVELDTYPADRLCPICEERTVFVKEVTTTVTDRTLLTGRCGQCGNVFDVPAHGATTDPTYPIVRADIALDGAADQTVEIEFENPTDAPVQATFQPMLDHADNVEHQFFHPERRDAVLDPGESHTAEFDVDVSLLDDHRYVITGAVVANLELYAGYTSTLVGDEAGYYPPHLR